MKKKSSKRPCPTCGGTGVLCKVDIWGRLCGWNIEPCPKCTKKK